MSVLPIDAADAAALPRLAAVIQALASSGFE